MYPLFFKNPVVLSSEDKGPAYIALPKNYEYAAVTNCIPLTVVEFEIACRYYPIVFTSGDEPTVIAVVGLEEGSNLFVDAQGEWAQKIYIPGYVRKFPFVFLESENAEQLTLCVENEYRGNETTDLPIFTEGKPTEEINTLLEFCKSFHAAWEATRGLTALLREADLLVDRRTDVAMNTGEKISLDGFSVIDREKYESLLQRDQGLSQFSPQHIAAIHAHFVSMNNWQFLVDMKAATQLPIIN